VILCRDYRRRSGFRHLRFSFSRDCRRPRFLRIFCPTGGSFFEALCRRRAGFIIDCLGALRSVEIDPRRVAQDRLAIGGAQLPHHQHGARISRSPSERFDQSLLRVPRERADFMGVGREGFRPFGMEKPNLPRCFPKAPLLLSFPVIGCLCRHDSSVAGGPRFIKTE